MNGNLKNGKTRTPIYQIWKNMHSRCSDPNSPQYKRNGARGVEVCREWKDFEVFEKWAIEKGYKDGMVILRINEDLDFIPWNCIITNKSHKRAVHASSFHEYKGKRLSVKEWSQWLNCNYSTLLSRKNRMGIEKAIESFL